MKKLSADAALQAFRDADKAGSAAEALSVLHDAYVTLSAEYALRALHEAHAARTASDAAEVQAVVDARAAGATTYEIADALGMHQPSFFRKYSSAWAGVTVPSRKDVVASERDAALDTVRAARRARHDAEVAELQAVADARTFSVTWDDIAAAVQMLQPNAVRKYEPLLVEHRTVTVRPDKVRKI